jgi:hypothetical protein
MTSTIPISKVRQQGASRDVYEEGRSLAVKKDGTVVAWGNWQKGSAPITSGVRIGSATLVQKGQSRVLLKIAVATSTVGSNAPVNALSGNATSV